MRSTPARLASILMALLAAATALAGAPPQRWVEVRSTHFIVLAESSEKDARRTAEQFERMHAVFHLLIPTSGDDSDPPITVLAVKDRKAMQSLEPEAYLGKGKMELGGLFLRAPDANYILVRLDTEAGAHPYATVYHEYTHYMLRKAESLLPPWFNEGLAQFYENTDIHNRDAQLGQPSPRAMQCLVTTPMIPLATLLAVDYRSPYYHEEDKGSIFYAESWALADFLIVDDRIHGTHRIRDYTDRLVSGEDPVTAGQHAFGDLDKLQVQLIDYLRLPTARFFEVKADLSPRDATFTARAVSQPEVDAVRANILIYAGRTKEAQALLGAVLQEDPNNELAHEAMGSLFYLRGDYDGARKWYAQAVALDSQSYLAHYFYAVITLRGGDRTQDDAIESSLQTSIKLNPQFTPAYDALAMFYATRRRNLDQAHMLTVRAMELEPETPQYRIDGAEVLAAQRRFANAIQVLKAAERLARTPDQLAEIESRVQRFQTEQARLDKAADSPTGSERDGVRLQDGTGR
ncbi:MAG: tetratricopeptide repeat protein [Acidobacteriaceae bacterium]|jgi:Tfp pilus assembly protein PilF